MVVEERLGERHESFETVKDRLADDSGSGCAAVDYDCAVVEKILNFKSNLKSEKDKNLVAKERLAAVDQQNGQD